MDYTTLGESGLQVSRICIGCMSFGETRDWFIDREESAAVVDRAMDLGINFFDTANTYADGQSEAFLGEALAGYDPGDYVVATKGFYGAGDVGPNRRGLSRKAIDHQLTGSLDRLGVDAVDLYLAHNWDPATPVAETLRALTDEVGRGRVRYLGASKFWAYQLATALEVSDEQGLERFVAMQDLYNLVYREEEREMVPLCAQEGVGLTPFSPLARGTLARPAEALESTTRGAAEDDRRRRWVPHTPETAEIRDRVEEVATKEDVTMAQVALAWLLEQPGVDAPIVGVTSVDHVEEAAEAVELSLSADTMAYLEEPYEPVEVIGLP